jgi:hypothetical protein
MYRDEPKKMLRKEKESKCKQNDEQNEVNII